MSTPVLTEAEVIATGRTVLARLSADDFSWPSDTRACMTLHVCRDSLTDSLEAWENVEAGRIHPGAVFEDLEHDDDAYSTALRLLADDVLAWARAAVDVVAWHCGHEAAEALKAAEVAPWAPSPGPSWTCWRTP